MSHDLFPWSLPQHRFTHDRRSLSRALFLCLFVCFFVCVFALAACSSRTEEPPAATPGAAEDRAEATVEEEEANASTGAVSEIDPYPPDQTAGPVRVQIEEIGLDAPIIAMGWRVDVVEGERTTVWDVPLDVAGWHINSVGAGGLGNTVISGRQVGGAAVFAPLALGSVATGQEVLLTDGDGIVFVYRIVEVTDPIPVTGATPDEIMRAAEYFAPTTTARLTLVTGWPEFTTTHRIFAVAEFVGVIR